MGESAGTSAILRRGTNTAPLNRQIGNGFIFRRFGELTMAPKVYAADRHALQRSATSWGFDHCSVGGFTTSGVCRRQWIALKGVRQLVRNILVAACSTEVAGSILAVQSWRTSQVGSRRVNLKSMHSLCGRQQSLVDIAFPGVMSTSVNLPMLSSGIQPAQRPKDRPLISIGVTPDPVGLSKASCSRIWAHSSR